MVSGNVPVIYLMNVSPALPSCSNLPASCGLFSAISFARISTAASCASIEVGLANKLSRSSAGRVLKSVGIFP